MMGSRETVVTKETGRIAMMRRYVDAAQRFKDETNQEAKSMRSADNRAASGGSVRYGMTLQKKSSIFPDPSGNETGLCLRDHDAPAPGARRLP